MVDDTWYSKELLVYESEDHLGLLDPDSSSLRVLALA